MSEITDNAKKVCITILSNEKNAVTPAIINSTIEKVGMIYPMSPEEKEILFRQLEELYAVFSDEYRILDDKKPVPWVKNRKAEFRWEFWNRYRLFLEAKNYAPDTINKLDDLTDDILDRLINPGSVERFDKRGLVVGHVQSGKTGNYTGLICKAADVGYKVIIVLAGIHNSLRSQTQLRIDEGFLGFDTQTARNFTQTSNRIGVGRINPNLAAHSLTTSDVNGDFNRRASESSGVSIRGKDPIVLVIKKNYSVLKNLLMWLGGRGETMNDGNKLIRNLPLLLIDDEADNASINISKSEVSRINGSIRAMLMLFEQSAYVGYTATPYANIFIKQDDGNEDKGFSLNFDSVSFAVGKDIFPKDFIVNIPAPSNYIGPARMFGIVSTEKIGPIDKDVPAISLYRIVDDYQPKEPPEEEEEKYAEYIRLMESIRMDNPQYIPDGHRMGDKIPEILPNSLKRAIKCFLLVCAARRARGQEKEHNSMLIHVSRFITWQDKIAKLVSNEFKHYLRQIEFNQGGLLGELKELWQEEFVAETKKLINDKEVSDPGIVETSWEDLEPHIWPAISKIDVRAVHGDTRVAGLEHPNIRPLDYFEQRNTGLSVIAIGGNKLSRGLTLEGLTISYYLRASKMYDTLMQMGRWFGYRPGYLDLCRLFTSEELVEWYRHITVATEEMRAEFDRMADLKQTPSEYGLKVRTHPGVLSITASNKFRYKQIMELSYSGELEETYSFPKQSVQQRGNLNNTLAFIKKLGIPQGAPNTMPAFDNHYVWTGKNNYALILEYLEQYKTTQAASFNTRLMAEYILAQVPHGNLRNWTVAVINNSVAKDDKKFEAGNGIEIGLTERSNAAGRAEPTYEIAKSHIIDPGHEYIDLSDIEISKAFELTKEDLFKKEKGQPEKETKAKEQKHPSPLRIKICRPSQNALLLIYFLDPHPKTWNYPEPLADCPIIGLAVSFPRIEGDEKIEYAVNEQFLGKRFDYQDEIDDQEYVDDWKEDIAEKNGELLDEVVRETNLRRNFEPFANLRFSEGALLPYNHRLIGEQKSSTGDLVFHDSGTDFSDGIPFVRSREISPFHIRSSDIEVQRGAMSINPGTIVGSRNEDRFVFAMTTAPCQPDQECTIVLADKVDTGYFLALLNSTLFDFYARKQKVEKVSVAVNAFPFRIIPEQDSLSFLSSVLPELMGQTKDKELQRIASYFINILDAAVFEIYFPEEFRVADCQVLSQLKNIDTSARSPENIKKLYKSLSKSSNPAFRALRALYGMPKIRAIYDFLK